MTLHSIVSNKSQDSYQIRSVQLLRAFAAVFVVLYHSTVLWHDKRPLEPSRVWENGNSGVDLFFVISGFIMVLSSKRLREQTDGWSKFIWLRLVRIVPLYWLTTAIKLVLVMAIPTVALHTRANVWNALASFLFIPSHDAVGNIVPILVVGWTLSFEMLFYLAFATAIYLSLSPLIVVTPVMVGLALLSSLRQISWPAIFVLADPIVLEFVLGMLIGSLLLARQMRQVPRLVAVLVGVLGLATLVLLPTHGPWERVLVWGIAAAATLWAALAIESWAGSAVPKSLIAIGEASYSLYLMHGFVLPVVGAIIVKVHLPPLAEGVALILASLVASIILSLLVYRYVELPMTQRLRATFGGRRSGSLATSQAPI